MGTSATGGCICATWPPGRSGALWVCPCSPDSGVPNHTARVPAQQPVSIRARQVQPGGGLCAAQHRGAARAHAAVTKLARPADGLRALRAAGATRHNTDWMHEVGAMAFIMQNSDPHAPHFYDNGGFEAGAYLSFIVTYYDCLPEKVGRVSDGSAHCAPRPARCTASCS